MVDWTAPVMRWRKPARVRISPSAYFKEVKMSTPRIEMTVDLTQEAIGFEECKAKYPNASEKELWILAQTILKGDLERQRKLNIGLGNLNKRILAIFEITENALTKICEADPSWRDLNAESALQMCIQIAKDALKNANVASSRIH